MKKLLIAGILALLSAAGGWAWWHWLYVEPPQEAFLRAVACATLGDEQGFLDGFTPESRPLLAGLLALSRGDDIRTSSRHPYHWLLTEEVQSVQVEGERAWVRVRRPGSQQEVDIPMVKAQRSWQVDALQFTGKVKAGGT